MAYCSPRSEMSESPPILKMIDLHIFHLGHFCREKKFASRRHLVSFQLSNKKVKLTFRAYCVPTPRAVWDRSSLGWCARSWSSRRSSTGGSPRACGSRTSRQRWTTERGGIGVEIVFFSRPWLYFVFWLHFVFWLYFKQTLMNEKWLSSSSEIGS